MLITRGDGRQITARGFDDPQAMRMILLQILTGRRASEIRTCLFDRSPRSPTRRSTPPSGNQSDPRLTCGVSVLASAV